MNARNIFSEAKIKKLQALGDEMEKLEDQRSDLLIKARKIIGFKHWSGHSGVDEELKEAKEKGGDYGETFIEYGKAAWRRWLLEENDE